MRRLGTAVAALLLAAAALLLSAAPAAAHASLVAVDPADGARVDESPARVQLTFSERVSVDLGGVRVLDADGDAVHDGTARASGEVVELDLAPDLPDGTYVISYRVTSADGHPVRGGSVFGVGDVEVDASALGRVGDGSDRGWEITGAVARGFAYAGVLVAAGGVAFLVLVHRHGDERLRLVRIVRAAAALGALATLGSLPVQAALGTGRGASAIFDDGVLAEVAGDGVGLGVALAGLGVLLAARTVTAAPVVALGAAAVAAGGFATNGHTRVGSLASLATAADVVHLWVVAAWGGGLLLLAVALHARRGGDDRAGTVGMVGRFSTLATAAIVLAGATGVLLGWREVRSLDALTGSGYGRLLVAKAALVGWVAALGAYNHLRLVPAAQAAKARAALHRLASTVRLEVVTLVAVVGVTAALVVVTPPQASARAGVVERIVELDDAGSVQITVAPARAGFNQIHLYLFDPDGRPAEIAEAVSLVLELPDAGVGPITRDAVRAGPAHLQLDGDDLAVAGTWTVEVKARVDRFTQVAGSTEIPIA